MITETLSKLREGLAAKRFTMKQLSEVADVPVSTIADMKRDRWQEKTISNLTAIEQGLAKLEAKTPSEAA